MNGRRELVQGWIRKAENDLRAVEMCLAGGKALDVACFHSQQAAEKFLKAYLIFSDTDFPFIHDLAKLIQLCADREPAFTQIKSMGEKLTPYAVELRYDSEFSPSPEVATEACEMAVGIRAFVLARMPANLLPDGGAQ
jgi:HEPN domain-containing protein